MKEKQERRYNKRNPEAVRKSLLDAVGALLEEKGHYGLGVNKVALKAKQNKSQIYWHFNSYNNLLKTYIKSKDFWAPVFEAFNARGSAEFKLPDSITLIMQELFRHLYTNKELQKLMLWQASESNSLLKEVSEQREKEGEKILALTDEHFESSAIDFRSVLAIVLGGIYNTVWHASNNKSSVIGIDINEERDRLKFERAIGFIISAIWNSAEAFPLV